MLFPERVRAYIGEKVSRNKLTPKQRRRLIQKLDRDAAKALKALRD